MTYQASPSGFRTFLIVWASQSVSVLGSTITFFALNIWLVQTAYPMEQQRQQLGWALAALGLALSLPAVVMTPFAGVMVDRLDRKRLMFLMDLLNGLLMTVVAFTMGAGLLRVWVVLVMAAILSATTAVHSAAFDTCYATLVTREQLPRANGLMQTMQSLVSIMAPALAVSMITLPVMARQGTITGTAGDILGVVQNGAALVLGVDAVSFFLAASVLLFLTIPSPQLSHQTSDKRTSVWDDVRLGVRYIYNRRPLLSLLAMVAIVNFLMPLGVFLPLVVKAKVQHGWTGPAYSFEAALASINTLGALGGILGGALVSVWGGLNRRVIGVTLFLVVEGLAVVVLGLSPTLFVAVLGMFLLDFANPIANAHSQAIWQSQVPWELQGRVFAVRRILAVGLQPMSQVLAGFVAGIVAPEVALVVMGSLITAVCAIQLFNRQLLLVDVEKYGVPTSNTYEL